MSTPQIVHDNDRGGGGKKVPGTITSTSTVLEGDDSSSGVRGSAHLPEDGDEIGDMDEGEDSESGLEGKLVRKIDLRLCTIAGILCSLNLLDSGIISSASVTSIFGDLGLGVGDRYVSFELLFSFLFSLFCFLFFGGWRWRWCALERQEEFGR